ncbi:hypothetical protein BRPE64_CCDS00660 [Caballeronia insecticola]|uniref:Uncharacterized protein n=1 Tax=Caballeronia insecticola TaxID=758793 RepID=R4WNM7_9BURK|nr:hypothetical protein BRPE64_CCDS00660 [Caballeronia insecticola]
MLHETCLLESSSGTNRFVWRFVQCGRCGPRSQEKNADVRESETKNAVFDSESKGRFGLSPMRFI